MTETTKAPNVVPLTIVREAVLGAAPAPEAAAVESPAAVLAAKARAPRAAKRDAPPAADDDGWRGDSRMRGAGGPTASETGLPAGCPVIPLGKQGETCFYLDGLGQLRGLKEKDHGRLGVMGLFGARNHLLREYWPRTDKNGNVTGWAPELTAEALLRAVARKGLWQPEAKVRGRGAWADGQGGLVLHMGDAVLVDGRLHEPGAIGGFVYPAFEWGPKPQPDDADDGAALELLAMLSTWAWRKPGIAPMLTLGWIMAALAGGALKWRPAAWITGGPGTGKSTLQDVIRHVLQDALISVSDASAAGIWQKLKHDSLPVAVDEAEAEADNRKIGNVVQLMRQAASGGLVLRGGQNHEGSEFTARSCFLFSSVLVPPLEPADLGRLAILELGPLPAGAMMRVDAKRLNAIGGALLRRLVMGWPRLEQALQQFQGALSRVGHGARGCDQFGTLLAMADLALHDQDVDTDSAEALAAQLNAGQMEEVFEQASDQERMLQHLLTKAVDPWRAGTRRSLGEWIEIAANLSPDPGLNPVDAQNVLRAYGLNLVDDPGGKFLAIANQHTELAAIFEKTKWYGRPGSAGGWRQSARRLDGARSPKDPLYFGSGPRARATLVPLHHVLPSVPMPAPQIEDRTEGGE